MVKSLFNICLSAVCQHQLNDHLALIPIECKQKLLEFFTNHDQLSTLDCDRLVSSPSFADNLTELKFYLSEDLSDSMLAALTANNKRLERITLVECPRVTDKVIRVTSLGIRFLVQRNPNIHCLYLNHCRSLDDQALYDIAYYVGERLRVLELDFLPSLADPAAALQHLSTQCPNVCQLSLARFFNESYDDFPPAVQFKIDGFNLRDIDLYGNYFVILPELPPTVHSLRLSVNGDENPFELVRSLEAQPFLKSINLQLTIREASIAAIDNANTLLSTILPYIGNKITILTDLETSQMLSVDDRFLAILGENCRQLRCINLNGCRWVSDKGMAALARRCPLREVRIRGTACTDQSIYTLAQFCPDLEWISYADYSGE
ncbi:hypothetical protein ANCDUO_12174 [Ancylostoma duodenale]|uniref:Leucine Rich repeat-containing domain protein n=1 Tax=Ancylostoma duodenale TaxID=51022 RepID=A0A0C2D688_9BILA|nr:hypothetical protein ANCDUO_12174 [Ancylostoma duodenale]